ncbi:hypothetical protein MesoLjLc_05670 [Mesorhizobium sp. L-8-10]|nr:hypothetical protein MesoLjLc_05670 [Mesorhizobium sp. L-8-10]
MPRRTRAPSPSSFVAAGRACPNGNLPLPDGSPGGTRHHGEFIMAWDEGKDNFVKHPPDATVSVPAGHGLKIEQAVVASMKQPRLDA